MMRSNVSGKKSAKRNELESMTIILTAEGHRDGEKLAALMKAIRSGGYVGVEGDNLEIPIFRTTIHVKPEDVVAELVV